MSQDGAPTGGPWTKPPRELHLFADYYEKIDLAEEIVSAQERQRPFAPEVRRHLLFRLSQMTLGELKEMQRTGTIAPNALGDAQKDLVYTPIQPCRIFDTRYSTAGRLYGGASGRPFFVADGVDMTSQGGPAGGCGIPHGAATAVHMNFLVVAGVGESYVTVWPWGSTQPFISLLYFYGSTNIPNAMTVPLCTGLQACNQGDIAIALGSGGNSHLIGDVLGYYSAFPVNARRTFAWDAQSQSTTTIAATCTNQSGAAIAVSVPEVGKMYVEGTAVIQVNHTFGTDDLIELSIGTSSADCTNAASRVTRHLIPSAAPSAGNYQFTLPVSAVFAVDPAVSTTATYFLNARNLGSTTGADSFVSSRLTVTFQPN